MHKKLITVISVLALTLTLAGCSGAQYESGIVSNNESQNLSFEHMSPEELNTEIQNKDFFLLDVHIPEQDHIEGTDAFIPYNDIPGFLDELPEDKTQKVVVYCRSGSMSLEASQELVNLGYENVYNLDGGRNAYIDYINQ